MIHLNIENDTFEHRKSLLNREKLWILETIVYIRTVTVCQIQTQLMIKMIKMMQIANF